LVYALWGWNQILEGFRLLRLFLLSLRRMGLSWFLSIGTSNGVGVQVIPMSWKDVFRFLGNLGDRLMMLFLRVLNKLLEWTARKNVLILFICFFFFLLVSLWGGLVVCFKLFYFSFLWVWSGLPWYWFLFLSNRFNFMFLQSV